MLKKFLLSLIILLISPVFAGELENALQKNQPVFLYLYTQNCGYCKKFTPFYNEYKQKYSNKYTFVKIDANTVYGYKIMRNLHARFVPYVALINNSEASQIHPSCLQVAVCMDEVLTSYRKNIK